MTSIIVLLLPLLGCLDVPQNGRCNDVMKLGHPLLHCLLYDLCSERPLLLRRSILLSVGVTGEQRLSVTRVQRYIGSTLKLMESMSLVCLFRRLSRLVKNRLNDRHGHNNTCPHLPYMI
jgi:hypothetical protein